MVIKAFILIEPYTLDTHLKSLVEELISNKIEPVLIHDVSELQDRINQEAPNQPILWFEHQNFYTPNITHLCNWLINNADGQFPAICDSSDSSDSSDSAAASSTSSTSSTSCNQSGRTLAFYPRGVQAVHGRYIVLKPHMFIALNVNKIFKAPEVENPRLIVYTHERDLYLQLTLNSVLHSLQSDRPPMTIVLNEPKNNVRSIALNFADKYSGQIDVLEVTPNSKMSAVCIALIWHRPKYFVVLEDDFILPSCVHKSYEHWPKQFVEKLNYFDLCGWGANFDNYPYVDTPQSWIHSQRYTNNKFLNGYLWMYNEKFNLMAQSLALSTDYFIKISRRLDRTATDLELFKQAQKGKCSPCALGYHIGWNQHQDGFQKLNTRDWGDFGWSGTYQVTNLVTNEKRTICPKKEL